MPGKNPELNAVMDIDITQVKKKFVEVRKDGDETTRRVIQNGKLISETVTKVSGATATGAIKANTAWTALMTTWTAGIAIANQIGNSVKSLVRFMTDATKAAQEDQKAIIGRNAALQATGQYTYEAAQALDEQASQLQRTLGISDSYTVEIQRQLAAQRLNVTQIEAATKASLGLARVMGGDLADNTKQISQFLEGTKDKLKGTTIEVDKNADAQERLAKLLEGSAAGLAILNAEAETTAGRAKTAAEAWGEIKETIGSQIGNSPDMASAFKAIAESLFKVNDGLKSTGGLGGLAAQALLVVSAAISRAMGRMQMAADFFDGGGLGGWGLPGDYTNPFLQADQDLSAALAEMQAKNQRYQNLPPELKGIYDYMGKVKEEAGGGLRIPIEQSTTPFFDSIGMSQKKEKKQPEFNEFMGFRPLGFTQLQAAGGTITPSIAYRGNGGAFIQRAKPHFEYPLLIPDLSNGTTGYSSLNNHPIVEKTLTQPTASLTNMQMLNKAFGPQGLAGIAGGFAGGGAKGGIGALLGVAGSAFGPWGAVAGGIAGKLFGNLFGGGHKDRNRGETPGRPVYVEDVKVASLLAQASNVSRSTGIGGASANVNWAMNQLHYAAAGGQQ